ncbi:MAG: prepilin peptidase [Roseburia sp.]
MKLGICILIAVIGSVINVYYWQACYQEAGKTEQNKLRLLIPKSIKGKISAGIMLLAMVLLGVVLAVEYKENTLIFDIKRMALVSVLWPMALSDYQKHIIPNSALKLGLIYWVILAVCEAIFEFADFKRYILAELIFVIVIFGVMMLLRLIIKDGIGMGDIKLLMLMALFQGENGLVSSVMTSLILLFFFAVGLLITRKKNRKDFIPFGPAILIGTYISIFTMGA